VHTPRHIRKNSGFSTQEEHIVLLGLEALTETPNLRYATRSNYLSSFRGTLYPAYVGKEEIAFPDVPGEVFPNPIYTIKGKDFSCSTFKCRTHGDLNATNVLIDQDKHAWLIDFYRTGPGHILRDCIELESVVKFELLSGGELQYRYTLEKALMAMRRFREVRNAAYDAPNEEYKKAFAIVRKIRELAKELVHPSDDMREYYQGLLYLSVNTLRFSHLPKLNRTHALLAAGMICKELGLRPT
jgi:hypothetical protein